MPLPVTNNSSVEGDLQELFREPVARGSSNVLKYFELYALVSNLFNHECVIPFFYQTSHTSLESF